MHFCLLRCLMNFFSQFFFPRLCSQSALFMCCSIFNRYMSVFRSEDVSHSSVFSLLHLLSKPQNGFFVSQRLTKVFECFHILLSAFRSRKCQTRIKEMGKRGQIEPAKTFGVLLGKLLEVVFQKRIHTNMKQTRDWTTSKMRRCGPQSRPLTTVSHNHQQHAAPPPPSYQWKPRTTTGQFTATGHVTHPKSRSQMVQRCWRNTDFWEMASWVRFISQELIASKKAIYCVFITEDKSIRRLRNKFCFSWCRIL